MTAGRAAGAARALAAAVALAALAAGLPWLMWHVTGWPLPRHLPDLATLKTGLTSRESPRVILDTLTCAGWAVWAVFICQTAAEAAWQIQHLPDLARTGLTPRRRAAALSPPRALAAVLIGAVVIGVLAAARGTTAPAAAQAQPRLPAATAAITLTATHNHARSDGRPLEVYTVREGDNLWDIAADHLGSGEAWHQLWDLNRYRSQPGGGELTDPNDIQPGWILLLPAPASPSRHFDRTPASTAHGGPAAHRPPPPRARPPHPASSPLRARRHPPGAPRQAGGHRQPAGNGVSLPSGGLAGAALAAAITTGLALAAVHRRRRYRPARTLTSRLDPAAPPVAPPVAALRHAHLAATTPVRDDDDDDPYSPVRAATADSGPHPLPAPVPADRPDDTQPDDTQPGPTGSLALGVRDGHELAADLAAVGGLGLTGPGAPAAARAITVGLLSRTLPGSPAAPAEIIIPAADAAILLPGYDHDEPGSEPLPGLAITPTLAAALDLAEETILRRARQAGVGYHDEDADGDGDGEHPPGRPQLPPAALIATPGPDAAARLRAIVRAGHDTGLAAILLASWPPGTTCQVSADGTASSTDPSLDGTRLFNLAADDTTAIITVLREARGAVPPPPASRHPDPGPPAPQQESGGPRSRAPASPPPPGQAPAGDRPAPASPARLGPQAARIIRIEVLGPLRILVRGTEIGGGLRKARELAALLAVHPCGVTGEEMSEALWPGVPPGHGTAQRGLALRKLREMLRDAAGITTPGIVVLAAGRYRLDPALVSTDMADFQATLDAARTAADDAGRLAACRTATALYRGPLAAGAGYEWAEPYAETARRRALDAWTRIAEILQPDDPDQALAAMETALSHDPYNEYLYQKIMHVQAAAGRPDAVRRTLALLETRLTEIGITPGTQTRQVAAALLIAPLPPPAPATP